MDLAATNNEILWLKINRNKCKPLIVCCIDRPSDKSAHDFLNLIEEPLSRTMRRVLLGDFNFEFGDQVTWRNLRLKRWYERLFPLYDFDQLIQEPTRITEHSRSTGCPKKTENHLNHQEHLTGDQRVTGSIPVGDSESFSERTA